MFRWKSIGNLVYKWSQDFDFWHFNFEELNTMIKTLSAHSWVFKLPVYSRSFYIQYSLIWQIAHLRFNLASWNYTYTNEYTTFCVTNLVTQIWQRRSSLMSWFKVFLYRERCWHVELWSKSCSLHNLRQSEEHSVFGCTIINLVFTE